LTRILLSTEEYPPRVGGVGVASQRLARNLAAAGYEVHVVAPYDTQGAACEVRTEEEEGRGLVVHRVYADAADPQASFVLRQLVRTLDDEWSFDLFHGFFLTAVYPCIAAAQRRQRPVIASIRGSDVLTMLDQPYCRGTILASLAKAAWITSVNQLYLDRVAEEVPVAGRSSVIRNGVAAIGGAPWQPGDHNRGVVGTIGQLRRVKDIPLLIRAYAGVPVELRRGLLLAGFFSEKDEEEWSRVLIGELGIESETTITGRFPHADAAKYLRSMHVYAQSSAYEGLPNALLEAASCGVPLVATRVGGMAEILTDGETALLADHGEPAQLRDAITRILGDDALALHLSAGARQLAAELSFENERDAWLALYARLLA
jgi:glycosyltransferase involved in cell wall biosynthesis